jgi:hypothetical protein
MTATENPRDLSDRELRAQLVAAREVQRDAEKIVNLYRAEIRRRNQVAYQASYRGAQRKAAIEHGAEMLIAQISTVEEARAKYLSLPEGKLKKAAWAQFKVVFASFEDGLSREAGPG